MRISMMKASRRMASKRRASRREARRPDRLSELPDSLLLQILSFLEMREVVRTTLLSKRWKDLWTTIPCLEFRDDTRNSFDTVSFRKFVSRALSLWKGAKILKFSLRFKMERSFPSEILDSWLLFAIEKQVEELHIRLYGSVLEYRAPQRLCFCPSIRKLSLLRCDLEIEDDVQWNQLESLAIDFTSVYPVMERAVNRILRRAPRLELLSVRLMEGGADLNIQSLSLKTLKIARRPQYSLIPGADRAMLRIEAPNLEKLKISDFPYTRCLLKVPSLTCVSLCIDDFNRASLEPHMIILVKEMLIQLLPIINHVEKVTLSDWCSKQFPLQMKKDMVIQFPNAEFLTLHASAPDQILGFLEMFPKLINLTLKHKDLRHFVVPRSLKPDLSKIHTVCPSPSKLHLRKVEINWLLHDFGTVIPFIKILFEDALFLEKMVLRPISYCGNQRWCSLVEKKLRSMPISSPTTEVIIIIEDVD